MTDQPGSDRQTDHEAVVAAITARRARRNHEPADSDHPVDVARRRIQESR